MNITNGMNDAMEKLGMKIGDAIKITAPFKGSKKDFIGKFGFIEEDAGLIQGVKHYIVILLENDGIPFGNGPVPISSIELTDDPIALNAYKIFNENIKKIMENTKSQAIDIDKGLEELSKKHNLSIAKLREIYTDVFELTKGIIYENQDQGKQEKQEDKR
jgi:hypothetical protein